MINCTRSYCRCFLLFSCFHVTVNKYSVDQVWTVLHVSKTICYTSSQNARFEIASHGGQ